ncbi:16S rRNA (cytosine(1402)-N(4))-methyltransferase RsmH [bacterium]|nr:16S rRNA (cytosine(1402)-N(4))-methyltransferase RsmH [bacterium]
MKTPEIFHLPVMTREVVELLVYDSSGIYVDATIGGGGHSEAILKKLKPEGRLIGIDRDEDAIRFAGERLKRWADQVVLVRSNFKGLNVLLKELSIKQVSGILFDLGVSSHQLDEGERGFSFSRPGPLDMRMDRSQELQAREIINHYPEEELTYLFRHYGEERYSRTIAREIIKARQEGDLNTTTELAKIIMNKIKTKNINKVLARIFQALRIAINSEMESLDIALNEALNTLVPGGRICFISYHSLEDRKVKDCLKLNAQDCICPPSLPICVCNHHKRIEILTPRPLMASTEEVKLNPRARSARLRAAFKI